MFTLEQIKTAHAKVKSGADFPAYIKEIAALGVFRYTTYVTDSHTDYFNQAGQQITSEGKYFPLIIADNSDASQFKKDLKEHQQGKTDYLTFCKDCARSGVERWVVEMHKMTCSYYDLSGAELLVETIPSV